MTIRRNSLHYRIQRVLFEEDAITLVPYVGRIVWTALYLPTVGSVFAVIIGIITYIIAPLFGYYSRRFEWLAFPTTGEEGVLHPRKELFKFGGIPIYGYTILISLLLCLSIGFNSLLPFVILLKAVAILAGTFVLSVCLASLATKEYLQVVKAYLRGIKQRISPPLEYQD